jgi:hypothetical protein
MLHVPDVKDGCYVDNVDVEKFGKAFPPGEKLRLAG